MVYYSIGDSVSGPSDRYCILSTPASSPIATSKPTFSCHFSSQASPPDLVSYARFKRESRPAVYFTMNSSPRPDHPAPINKSALSFIMLRSSTFPHKEPAFTQQGIDRRRYWNGTCDATRRPSRHNATRNMLVPSQLEISTGRLGCSAVSMSSITKATRFCAVDSCMKLSKHNKRCWRHGGSIKCKVTDCDNRAKSKGVCWSHGGGTLCRVEDCDTISVSKGFCWAHGGGKRCLLPNCSKPAYERTNNYCVGHFKALRVSLDTVGCCAPIKSKKSNAEFGYKVE